MCYDQLPRYAKLTPLFQQHKRQLYTWTSPDGQYQNQTDYILCSWRWWSSIQSTKQDTELTVAQIMNSLLQNSDLNWRKSEIEKTTKPFTYDLNQIPCNYTVEVTNKFEGIGLIDSVQRPMHGGLWHCTEGSGQNHLQEKKFIKAKWLSEEDLQITEKRRETKGKGEKARYTRLNVEFQRIAGRDKKAFLWLIQRSRGKLQNGKD